MTTPSNSSQRRLARVLLGLFVLAQLVFLLARNGLGMLRSSSLPDGVQNTLERLSPGWKQKKGHLRELSRMIYEPAEAWSQLTGQPQDWALFAPTVTDECTFPAVELIWAEDPASASALARPLSLLAAVHPWQALACAATQLGHVDMPAAPELWLSDNEPRDIHHFFRFGNFRLRRFESSIVLNLTPSNDDEETAEQWRGPIEEHVRENGPVLQAYLRWRMEQILAKRADGARPAQVVLWMRRYHINAPPATRTWEGPSAVRLVRWQPGVAWGRDYLPVEMYNPVSRRFEGVRK